MKHPFDTMDILRNFRKGVCHRRYRKKFVPRGVYVRRSNIYKREISQKSDEHSYVEDEDASRVKVIRNSQSEQEGSSSGYHDIELAGTDALHEFMHRKDDLDSPSPEDISEPEIVLETNMDSIKHTKEFIKRSPNFGSGKKKRSLSDSDLEESKDYSFSEDYKEKDTDIMVSESIEEGQIRKQLFDSDLFSHAKASNSFIRHSTYKEPVPNLSTNLLTSTPKLVRFKTQIKDENGRHSEIPHHRILLNLDSDNSKIFNKQISDVPSIDESSSADSPANGFEVKQISIPCTSNM